MAIIVDKVTREKRLAICKACPSLIQLTIFGIPVPGDKPQCAICLCLVKPKTWLAVEKCSLNNPKWGAHKPS